jgi:protein-tyrosine-phosphatase
MAQCYLEHLMAIHPQLTRHFSRVLSSGLSASKPGVQLPPGVDYMLRDYGVSHNFKHVSRRLEKRDVDKFEFVLGLIFSLSCKRLWIDLTRLAMNYTHVQEILHTWPPTQTLENGPDQSIESLELTTFHGRENVRLLGSFGGHDRREVTIPEAINHTHWFQVGTRRIVRITTNNVLEGSLSR